MGGFHKKTIRDVDLRDKRVLLRVDYNVPLDDNHQVVDDYRLRMSLPTLEYLLEQNCKIIAMSHLGRPEGYDPNYSLAPVARRLQQLLPDANIAFIDGTSGEAVKKALSKRHKSTITLLENVRFDPREESEDEEYARELATYADVFVQDAFGVVHRKHVTLTGVPKYLPSYAGFLLEKEYEIINGALEEPERPLMAVIGGAKISDKIKVLKRFVEKADKVAVVGAMANTFLLAKGVEIGSSLAEPEQVRLAQEIIELAESKAEQGFELIIPSDFVVSRSIDGNMATRVVETDDYFYIDLEFYPKQPPKHSHTVEADESILDIGPASSNYIAGQITSSKTVLWSGTAGVAEKPGLHGAAAPFAHGSLTLAKAMSGQFRARTKPFTIAGGGDTVAFIESIPGLREALGHVSTGGSTSLELMSGNSLPGVEVLEDKD
ncbi:phosphoglycerate kinase [Candidatus Saccharibacteria bacterium]|nr:phosphoglycerate kinase [Candidatus Saccharibacteria bacterium]